MGVCFTEFSQTPESGLVYLDNSTTRVDPIIFLGCTSDRNSTFRVLVRVQLEGHLHTLPVSNWREDFPVYVDEENGYTVVYNSIYQANGNVCRVAEVTLDPSRALNVTAFIGKVQYYINLVVPEREKFGEVTIVRVETDKSECACVCVCVSGCVCE